MSTAVKMPERQKSPAETLKEYLTRPAVLSAIGAVAARHVEPSRLARIAIQAAQRNPDLLQCTPASIALCLASAAQLGLEAGGLLGSAYLVPFKNRHTGKTEAQLIIGYRGLIDLARRSEQIEKVEARVVFDGDTFEIDYGAGTIRHVPKMLKPVTDEDSQVPDESGKGNAPAGFVGAYAVATFRSGARQMEFMDAADIERIRRRSRASTSGPWVTDYAEMARKTVVRRLAKYLPLTAELSRAVEIENNAEAGGSIRDVTPDMPEISALGTDDETPALPPPAETAKEKLRETEASDFVLDGGRDKKGK